MSKINKKQQKKLLIDIMRGDEELGLYDLNLYDGITYQQEIYDWFEKEYPNIPLINLKHSTITIFFIPKPRLVIRHRLSSEFWYHGLFIEINKDKKNNDVFKRNIQKLGYDYYQCSSVEEFKNITVKYLNKNK